MDDGAGGAAGSRVPMWKPVFLTHHQLRGGKGGAGRGLFSFALKDIVCDKCFSTHF